MTLLGGPGAGQGAVLNALCGMEIVPPNAGWPTTSIRFGETETYAATLSDRRVEQGSGLPRLSDFPTPPALIELTAPLPVLRRVSILAVLPRTAAEIAPALGWAAARTEITVWCSPAIGEAELAFWRGAPDRLRNHAFLAATGAAEVPAAARVEFLEVVPVGGVKGPAEVSGLLAAIRRSVDEARAEDLDAARLLLRQHGSGDTQRPAPIRAAASRPVVPRLVTATPDPKSAPPPAASPPAAPRPASPVAGTGALVIPFERPDLRPPEAADARAALARVFHHLRRDASRLLAALDDVGTGDCADLLAGLETALSELAQEFDRDRNLRTTWPALSEAAAEAAEMALLLRYEGGADQAAEAAALMLQLRQDLEQELAA